MGIRPLRRTAIMNVALASAQRPSEHRQTHVCHRDSWPRRTESTSVASSACHASSTAPRSLLLRLLSPRALSARELGNLIRWPNPASAGGGAQ